MNRFMSGALAAAIGLATLSACGGGGATVSAPASNAPAPTAPGTAASATPGGKPTATPTPAGASSPNPGATATAAPGTNAMPAPTAPPDAAGYTNVVPTVPSGTACRPGGSYNVYVNSAPTDIAPSGTIEAFTVYEPAQLCGNQTYPLIFNGPGFGGSRTSTATAYFTRLTTAGYGVISVDEAGEGEDGGKIRVMDPDQEGRMLLAVMDWAQAKLSWLAYGPTLEGDDPHEPIMGSDGGSYGGMYQFMLLNVDKRHRLRAITPQITPANLNYSLFQGGVIKTLWNSVLFGFGTTAGSGTSRGNFDPFIQNVFVTDNVANAEDAQAKDFFGYHSVDYFCNGASIATNGNATNPGNAPQLPPTTKMPIVNALVYIGVRDTLFNFNNGYENYRCLQRAGGDVRLLSYQSGHNSLKVVPDPYVAIYYPQNDDSDTRCGAQLAQADAEVAWFDEYLKGKRGAASAIPKDPCISFSAGDGVTVPVIPQIDDPRSPAFTSFPVSLTVTSGDPSQMLVTQTLMTAPAMGAMVVGIPHIKLALAEVAAIPGSLPIAFVGLCVTHASTPGVDLVDNEVTPLRGVGNYDLDLVGGGIRLLGGDTLAICAQGLNSQYQSNGSLNVAAPTLEPITLTGSVAVPILASQPTI